MMMKRAESRASVVLVCALAWAVGGCGTSASGPDGSLGRGGITDSGGVEGSAGTSGHGGTVGTGGAAGKGGATGSGGVFSGGVGGGGSGTGGMAAGGVGGGGRSGIGGVAAGGVGGGGRSGIGGGDSGSGSGGNNTVVDPELVLWYGFDQDSGATTADTSAFMGGPRDGTLMTLGAGTVGFSATARVGTHALALGGNSAMNTGFVAIPSLQTLAPDALTIAAWINNQANPGTTAGNSDVFSFSTDRDNYMSLLVTTRPGMNSSFQINTGGVVQRILFSTPISLGAWHHLAVVLQADASYTGVVYLDGVAVASLSNMNLHASNLGATTANYIGMYAIAAGMSAFTGSIDDFRVYKRALNPAEIAALALATTL